MSFRLPSLEDAAAIVRPLDMALLKDLRSSVFLERIRVITRNLKADAITRNIAVNHLEKAIKDFENAARHGEA